MSMFLRPPLAFRKIGEHGKLAELIADSPLVERKNNNGHAAAVRQRRELGP